MAVLRVLPVRTGGGCCAVASELLIARQPPHGAPRCLAAPRRRLTRSISAAASEDDHGGAKGFVETTRTHNGAQECLKKAGSASLAALLAVLQAVGPTSGDGLWRPQPAEAVLYSPDTKIPRSPEIALRKAIPAVNPTMKSIQSSLEEIFFLLRIPQRKPFGTMESNVKKAIEMASKDKEAILAVLPADQKEAGAQYFEDFTKGKNGLEGLLAAIQLQDPDKISIRLANTLDSVGNLELLMAPGLPFLVSSQYTNLPRLTGRATAVFKINKNDGSTFTVSEGGGGKSSAAIEVVLDGYSAPLTAGNFVDQVVKGAYDGIPLAATSQAILMQSPKSTGNEVPLEIMPAGELSPIYRTPLNVQDGELPVLPLSVYGAVAMSHSVESETYSHPSQFFFYLYDKKSSGLGGLSFEEGQFSVFGYITKGRDLLSQLRTGDTLESVKISSGLEHFVNATAEAG